VVACGTPSLVTRPLNQVASFTPSVVATYSASVVDRATID